MEFFNIGGLEVVLILVIALIVLGPDRIVKVGRQLGTWLRKLSKNVLFREVVQTTDEIRNYPRKIMDEAKLDPSLRDLSKKITSEWEEPLASQEEIILDTSEHSHVAKSGNNQTHPEQPFGP